MNDDIVKVELQWSYKPKNFLKEDVTIKKEGRDIHFSNGTIKAFVEPEIYKKGNITEELVELVISRLYANVIIHNKSFELNELPSRSEYLRDGDKRVYLTGTVNLKDSASGITIVGKMDNKGNIISDPKQEIRNRVDWLSESFYRYYGKNDTLKQLISSYQMSVKEPHNEFIHLYEICDTLKVKIGSQSEAENILDIADEWDLLGRLANNEPYKQGRHRGKFSGNLKDAPQKELEKARNAARIIIEKYLKYLDKNT